MVKTKALISFAVTAKLICAFVFAHGKSRFSHNEAQMVKTGQTFLTFVSVMGTWPGVHGGLSEVSK